MKKIIKSRIFVGSLAIVLGLIIMLIVQPYFVKKSNEQVEIIRAKVDLLQGEKITEKQTEKVFILKKNLPLNAVSKQEDVINKYSTSKIFAGDFLTNEKISVKKTSEDYLDNIPEGKMAISVSLNSLAEGLSGKLERNDVVRIFSVNETAESLETLQYVLVLAATNNEGLDKENVEKETNKKEKIPKTITLLVNQRQAKDLAYLEEKEKIHTALVYRGEKKIREEFLKQQEEILKEIELKEQEKKEGQETPASVVPINPEGQGGQ